MASHFHCHSPDPRDWPKDLRDYAASQMSEEQRQRINYPWEAVFAWLPVRLSEPPHYARNGEWAWMRWVYRITLPRPPFAYVHMKTKEEMERGIEYAPLTDRRTLGQKRR